MCVFSDISLFIYTTLHTTYTADVQVLCKSPTIYRQLHTIHTGFEIHLSFSQIGKFSKKYQRTTYQMYHIGIQNLLRLVRLVHGTLSPDYTTDYIKYEIEK